MMFKLIYRNLIFKPLNGFLSLTLLTLSVAIISLLLVTGSQISSKLDNDLRDVDMVVGAKGSPLQLVLSAIYHVDAPTGNISKAAADKLAGNPMVERAIPLAYGDSYKGFRILGTTDDYIKMYGASLAEGRLNQKTMEIIVGADIAKKLKLKPGDNFYGTHGDNERGEVHENHPYVITGVLKPSNSVIDQLFLTTIESVWHIHQEGHSHEQPTEKDDEHHTGQKDEHGAHESDYAIEEKNQAAIPNEKGQDHNDEQENGNGHKDDHEEENGGDKEEPNIKKVDSEADSEITAMLLKFRSPMAILLLPRTINEDTNMQAAVPSLEINRLLNLMGIGITALQGIAMAIMGIAGLSVFISLYNRLKERQFENALLRTMGTSRGGIFGLLLAEGLILSMLGFILGVSLCRLGLFFLNKIAATDFRFSFQYNWVHQEWWLLTITILIGIFAAIVPAIKAYKLNIAKTLSDG